jgi:hypothetical protein
MLFAGAAVLSALPVQAQQPDQAPRLTSEQGIDIYLSENAFQAMYARQLRMEEFAPIEIRGGVFYNEARDLIAIADGLFRIGEVEPRERLVFKAGPRMYGAFLSTENEDVFAIGVGGEAEYFLGRLQSTSIMLAAYYSPDILTFGSADNMSDVSLQIKFGLNSSVNVYAGYRLFEIETLAGDREVDDHLHLGFRYNF